MKITYAISSVISNSDKGNQVTKTIMWKTIGQQRYSHSAKLSPHWLPANSKEENLPLCWRELGAPP